MNKEKAKNLIKILMASRCSDCRYFGELPICAEKCDFEQAVDMAIEALEGKDTNVPTKDCISRQDATTLPFLPKEHREYQTNNLDDAFEYGWMELTKCIELLPSAEPKTGYWTKYDSTYRTAICSQCKKVTMFEVWGDKVRPYDFCPNCGAKMGGGGE